MQVLPAQQPFAQEVPSQTQAPPTQRWPRLHAGPDPQTQLPPASQPSAVTPQAAQAEPAAPHDPRPRGMQAPPAQQPLGQELASQAQLPDTQRCPTAHAAPAPH